MRAPKNLVLFFLAGVVLVALSVFTYRAIKWAQGFMHQASVTSVKAPAPANSAAVARNNGSLGNAFAPAQIGAAMSEAFKTQKLPQPLALTGTDPDAAAIELARLVSRRDEHSTEALVGALKMAGFNIRTQDGSVLVGEKNAGQGIAFDDWEVAAMAKLYGDGFHISLADLSSTFTETMPGFKKVPLSDLLLQGIRTDVDCKKPELRFWARFIVELGRNADPSYDWLSANLDAASVQVDPVQFGLIMRRLVADLAILGSQDSGKKNSKESRNFDRPGKARSAALFTFDGQRMDAEWRDDYRPRYLAVGFQEGNPNSTSLPCNLSETAQQILDVAGYAYGFGFDKLIELLKEPGVLTEGAAAVFKFYEKVTLIANAFLTYAKLVVTSMTLNATITMDSSPLVRSIDPQAGCRRTLTASIYQKTGNWQIVNCLRTALNNVGIDVSLPSNGPLKEAPTQWHILEGGANVQEAGKLGYNPAIVEWVSNGPHIQDAGTYAGVPGAAPGVAVSDFTQAKTDENGVVTVQIEGFPRKDSLQGWAVPVMKTAKVQVTFASKPPNLRQDLIDSMGAAGLISGPWVLLTTVPVEMMLRSRWFASPVYTIPVKDWKRCNGGWAGTVTFEHTQHWNESHRTGGFNGQFETTTYTAEAKDSQTWELGGLIGRDGLVAADWTWVVNEHTTGVAVQNPGGVTSRGESTTVGSDHAEVKAQVMAGENTAISGTYTITLYFPAASDVNPNAIKWTSRNSNGNNVNAPIERTWGFQGSAPATITAQFDPQDPGHLTGTRETKGPSGTIDTLHWDLQPCGRVGNVCSQ